MALGIFSRFIICVHIPSISHQQIIDAFNHRWFAFVDIPRYVIREGGPGLVGRAWEVFTEIFNVASISSHVRDPNPTGAIERNVGLLKISANLRQSADTGMPFREVPRQSCVAKNHPPCLVVGIAL